MLRCEMTSHVLDSGNLAYLSFTTRLGAIKNKKELSVVL